VAALAGLGGEPSREPFRSPVVDFYLTNPIARASRVLAECSQLARERVLQAAE
jgi:NADH-quinone oxidoreductase subunit G